MITLYQFPHSHFSEKARWALDFKGLDYDIVNLPRGKHIKITQKLGLPETSVPIIEDGDVLLQGSGAILTYLDEAYTEKPLMPEDLTLHRQIIDFEAHIDMAVGHHGRRYIYSIFLDHPALLKDLFMRDANPIMRAAFPLIYPKIRRMLIEKLQLTEQATTESKTILEAAFADLNQRLDGQEFLFGGEMTRADISVASLSSIFTWPAEHAFAFPEESTLPDAVKAFRAGLAEQRFYQWGLDLYRSSRLIG